jgi:hypothetical protein
MAGNQQDWNWDAPGGRAESEAAVREGLAQAVSATAADQRAAHDFFVASGARVVNGHPDVRKAGAQGDPQLGMEPSS